VTLEFTWGTDMDFAGIEVREKLDLLQLPLEATRPLILRFDPSSEPVLRFALLDTAPTRTPSRRKSARNRCAGSRGSPQTGHRVGRGYRRGQSQRRTGR